MLIVRPATTHDAESLFDLARQAGAGFTSLAVGDEQLRIRLEKSEKSFKSESRISPDHVYLLMLEETNTGEILGMSAVKAQIGMRDPFFNFRILKVAQKSTVADKRFDMDVLMLVNEYAGATEVGSLFLTEKARGRGAGRLISQARYMLMAADKTRFSDTVISELRGVVDEAGFSPFWEAVGRPFFHMDFNEADKISAEKDNQFILDLMPKHPIYAAMLPDAARTAIGKVHPAGEGALRYLRKEGFRYNGVVDIFDAGPSVSAPWDDIRTISDSRILTVKAGTGKQSFTALVSNDDIAGFRCILTSMDFDGNIAVLAQKDLGALGLSDGANARIWIKR